MSVVEPTQVVDVAFRNMEARFWRTVAETLGRVFANGPEQAVDFCRRLETYREQLARASAEEQLLVYHSEPLDVAADLAGAKITRNHIDAYLELVQERAEA